VKRLLPLGLLLLAVLLPFLLHSVGAASDDTTHQQHGATHLDARRKPRPQPTPTPAPPAAPTPAPAPTASPSPSPAPGDTPVAGQPCPQWVHDRIVTIGPDGRTYPTWHGAVDEQYGCTFGHEHGADPRTSKADNTMPAFGYAAALMGMDEPHVGFKVFVMDHGYTEAGKTVPADVRMVFHMGTSGVKRFTERHHSIEYDYVARDGSGRYAHVYGMADTGGIAGSVCTRGTNPGKTFAEIACNDTYEIWPIQFQIIHPDDPYTGALETRLTIGGAVAAFDPVLTRDPADNSRVVYTLQARQPNSTVDPLSPQSRYRGCEREFYAGPIYWRNTGQPTVYYTDPHGHVKPGPGPGLIEQRVSATTSTDNLQVKRRQDFCGASIHAPN
jgi:hypothetical protein